MDIKSEKNSEKKKEMDISLKAKKSLEKKIIQVIIKISQIIQWVKAYQLKPILLKITK